MPDGQRISRIILTLAIVIGATIGCQGGVSKPLSGSIDMGEPNRGHHEGPELGRYMGELQRFSQKLGYSIEARNRRLAEFYLEEIVEALEDVQRDVPEHDGWPIASLIDIIVEPEIEPFELALAQEDWAEAWRRYEVLIDTCNRCHAATEHEFLFITPASGKPPFNQRFEPVP